jgi:hypothetical protein
MAESKKLWGLGRTDFAPPEVPLVVNHPWPPWLLGLGEADALLVKAYRVEWRCGRVGSAAMQQSLLVVDKLLL